MNDQAYSPLPNNLNQTYTTSPGVVNNTVNPTMNQGVNMNFNEMIQKVMQGGKVTRPEWNGWYAYFDDTILKLMEPNNTNKHNWIIDKADILATNYYTL